MRSIVFTNPAAQDLDEITHYIALDNPTAAKAFFQDVSRILENLASFPEIGRRGRIAGTREVVLGKAPYLIAYRPTHDRITVLAVFHLARDMRGLGRSRGTER